MWPSTWAATGACGRTLQQAAGSDLPWRWDKVPNEGAPSTAAEARPAKIAEVREDEAQAAEAFEPDLPGSAPASKRGKVAMDNMVDELELQMETNKLGRPASKRQKQHSEETPPKTQKRPKPKQRLKQKPKAKAASEVPAKLIVSTQARPRSLRSACRTARCTLPLAPGACSRRAVNWTKPSTLPTIQKDARKRLRSYVQELS